MRAGNAGSRFYCLIVDRILPIAQVIETLCANSVFCCSNRNIDSDIGYGEISQALAIYFTLPESGSYKRIASDINVDFPTPVPPTMAVMLPFRGSDSLLKAPVFLVIPKGY